MTTRLISAATLVMAFALLIASTAWAQDNDPCAEFTGKAKALCTAMIQVCAGPQTTSLHPRKPATR